MHPAAAIRMLEIGHFRSRTCQGLSRRAFLRVGTAVPLGLGLAAPAVAAGRVRAKSVIFVWLWGAPSHIDTFDPKPNAPADVRGPFCPIATRTPGLRLSELLPRMASRSDLFNVIHSHQTSAPGHPDAGTVGLTGFADEPKPTQPNFGSIIAKHRGAGGDLPPFVSLGRGVPRDVVRIVDGYGGGKLGAVYDPFMLSCSREGNAEIPSLDLLSELRPQRLLDRRSLLRTLDTAERQAELATGGAWSRLYDRAYDLLLKRESRAAFDLSSESPATHQMYGSTSFGQSCLLARRLVEAGVPYIQVNWSEYVECMTPNCDFGWDTHIYNFELLQDRHCPILDRAFSALLADLDQRGLLETTLVVAMGEFGRTPKLSRRASRDHWPRCYSSIWAGAGMTTGRVIGASDKLAAEPATMPITPLMVGTTIAELAGLDARARAEMGVLDGGRVVDELLA